MYAYIRYIEKNGKATENRKIIISTDQIKGFNSKKHKRNIKYKVNRPGESADDEVEILLLDETEQSLVSKVEDMNSKRIRGMPQKLLISASSESESNDRKMKNKKDYVNKRNSSPDDYVQRKLKEFQSTNNINPSLSPKPKNQSGKSNINNSQNGKENKVLKRTNISPLRDGPSCKEMKKIPSPRDLTKKVGVKILRDELKLKEFQFTNNINPSNGKENKELKSWTNISPLRDGPSCKEMKKIPSPRDLTKKVGVKILRDELMHSTLQCNTKIESMTKEIEALKKLNTSINSQLREALAQKVNIMKSKDFYKKKYQEQEIEYKSLLKLNQEFQTSMIEKTKETQEMFERLIASQKDVPLGCSFPAIGALRTSDNIKRYHIGNDIWLSETEYTGLLSASKKPSQLAGNVTTLVFTVDELLTSTKTGYKSRRSGAGKVKCGKLDPVKLAACEGYYKYWLQNIYIPVSKEDARNLTVDLIRYTYYAGKRIADMKKVRPVEKNNKNKVKNIKLFKKENGSKNENEVSEGEFKPQNNELESEEEKNYGYIYNDETEYEEDRTTNNCENEEDEEKNDESENEEKNNGHDYTSDENENLYNSEEI